MRTRISALLLPLSFALLAGCSSSRKASEPVAAVPVAAPQGTRSEVNLSGLLAQPRPELAKLAGETADRIRFHERSLQERRLELGLVSSFRLPLVVPVWREAKYSEKVGFSLPPYATEGTKDSVLALHLARFGDDQAARKLAEAGDGAKLDACKYQRNYPVEWSRLVGLLLHDAQMRVAAGDLEGLNDLIALHTQLRTVLDAKAARGPLGSALLGRGRRVLTEAASAARSGKRADLAVPAEKALKEWGDVPPLSPPVEPGVARGDVERLLGATGKGRATAASTLGRAFDLLALPLPDRGARSVVAFFDGGDRLTQVQVTYADGMAERYSGPNQLATLIDEVVTGKDVPQADGLRRRTYSGSPFSWDVFTVAHRIGVGAVARCLSANGHEPALTRDFGLVNLDRSFEQNRVRFAPEQRGDTVNVKQAKTLAQVTNEVGGVKPNLAILQREAGHDLTARFALQFPAAESAAPELHQLALPLWSAWGPCRFDDVKRHAASYLALVWQDAKTEHALHLPYAKAPLEWEARDRRTGAQLTARAEEAAAFDRKEREGRLTSGKAQTRVPRSREGLHLGMKREQVSKLLPVGQAVQKREFPGGVLATLTGEGAPNAVAVPREILARLGADQQLVELRVRYIDGKVARDPAFKGQDLLSDLTRRCGAPQEGPAPSSVVWSDLSRPKQPPLQYRWQDDLSVATCTRDGGVTEVVLRDRATGTLPPLDFLPRGPVGCVLGVPREDLLRQWNVTTPNVLADGALVLTPQTPRPYDALLVWFENGRVARVVARHDAGASRGPTPAQLAQAVSEAWGRDLRTLGWPSRQDATPQGVTQGLGWHDGVTRVRTFWQEQDDGPPRVYTEWKALGSP